ncbi:ribosomal subunit interface protein [Candidatus Uhrbacteria bacterium RIFCSPHIGHO2_02_FULL_54_11]|nr:MAG: ribosomal subunit interface protein [Candidatus Uhrbacteria bacterium RIFCSPHIGHO2_02_FULL_54_11]
MRLGNIKATNIELTPAIREYVEEKLAYLDELLPSDPSIMADVEVGKTTHHHQKGDVMRCEVNLQVPGALLRVEKTEKDLYKAIDKVKDHLARQIKDWRGRQIGKHRGPRPDKA